MGDIRSKVHDDIEEYRALCELYGEKPQKSKDAYGNMLLDPYGPHARELKQRRQQELD
jgi:hypothetical protein